MTIDLNDYLVLVLGWLLGILSPAIVVTIRDKREAKTIKAALISELHELHYRLLLNVYLIESKYSILDHKFFKWAQSVLTQYKGINTAESLLNTIGPLLNFTKDEMAIYNQMAKQQRQPNSGTSLKKHSLPFLETSINALAKFDSIFRGQLLEIKTRIGFLNEITDEARYYYQLSFQNGISPENYNIANTNMINSYKFYASRARDIIKIIGEILDKK